MNNKSVVLQGSSGLMDLSIPKVMGIINLTPDSFYSESRAMQINQVMAQVEAMIEEGADMIDFGAMSTRPGASEPSVSEELDRLIVPLTAIRAAYPELWISIDTYRSEVLKECLNLQVDMVNDISAGSMDKDFLALVAKSGLPYVLMHMQGRPQTMQSQPFYDDVVLDIIKALDKQSHHCQSIGISQVIIDPGFGFGKTIEDNFRLLKNLGSFEMLELPILVGISRKSMIYKSLNTTADHALNGTTALHMEALHNGASILRVHDVKEAKECIKLWQMLNEV